MNRTILASAIGLYAIGITVASFGVVRASTLINNSDNKPAASNGLRPFSVASPASSSVVHTFGPGLAMISVPSDYTGQSLASVLGYTSPLLAVWDPTADMYDLTPTPPSNSLTVGQGYWVRFPATESIATDGTPTSTNAPFFVTLQNGWNMVGDPFPAEEPISATSITPTGGATQSFAAAVSNGLIEGTLFTFGSGDTDYEVIPSATGFMTPYLGYWLFASTDGTMSVPPPSIPSTIARPVVNDPSAPMGFSFHSPGDGQRR